MMERTIYSPDSKRLGELKDREGVELFRDLLWCDAVRLSLRNITISLNTTDADGGIDAKADSEQSSEAGVVSGSFHFQIKTGRTFKPWQESHVKKELFGPKGIRSKNRFGGAVRACLDAGGTYVLVTFGYDLSPINQATAIDLFKRQFRGCGYKNPSVEVWGQGHLVKLLERYPSLCMDLGERGSATFQTLKSWALNSDMSPKVELGEPQRKFEQELGDLLRGDAIQHIRVIAEPGIGKTRLVLETLRSAEDLAARCVYVPQAGLFQNGRLFNELLKADRDYWVLLVIDECDEVDRASIWAALKGRKRVKLITIDHGPETSADESMKTLQFPALEQAQVEAILHIYVPSGDVFNWAAWCGGSARVAHAVGENLKRNPDDLLKSPATVPIWDRFILGYRRRDGAEAERLRVVMRHVALFRKFGFKTPVAEEGRYIATMAAQVDHSLSAGQFSSDIVKYCSRRVLQGSHTLRIVPKALHVHLWREWWEHYGGSADLASMMRGMPGTLQRWFLDMFIYANGVEAAQRAVRRVLSIHDGPFADKRFLTSDSGTRFIDTLAEADPAATIELLRSTIGRWPSAEVDEWQTGRQNIVFALEKIAAWKEHFRAAATILGRMALADQSTNSNNAKGTLLGLFDLRGGPTEAAPDIRLAVARSWLESAHERERRLGVEACGASLNLRGTVRIVGVEYQGLKPEIKFWEAMTAEDLTVPWRQALSMLIEENRKRDAVWKLLTSREIIQRADEMLGFNCLPDDALDLLVELARDSANDIELLTQRVISRLRITPDLLEPATLKRLTELEKSLGEGPFAVRLKRFAIFNTWDEDYVYKGDDIEESDVPDQRLAALAQELLGTPGLLDEHLPTLLQSEGYRIVKFGRHVALAAAGDGPDTPILSRTGNLESTVKSGFICGYLIGVRELDSARWEALALQLLAEADRGLWRVDAAVSSGSSPALVDKLLALYRTGAIDSTHFEPVGRIGGSDDNSLVEVQAVLEALLARPDEHSHRVSVQIAFRRFCGETTDGHDPEDLLWRVLTQASNFATGANAMDDHYWTGLAKRFRVRFTGHDLPLLSIMLERTADKPRLRAAGSIHEIAAEICKRDPQGAWKIIAETLNDQTVQSGWSFRHWLGDTGMRANPVPPLIECFDPADVMHWIDVMGWSPLPEAASTCQGGKWECSTNQKRRPR